LINDRVDVALAAEADGVHIGWDDMSPADARLLLGKTAIIGLSIKTLEQAQTAPLDLLDYVAIGGVYGTTSKDNTSTPIGLAGLRAIAAAVRSRKANFPICAIAGINEDNAGDDESGQKNDSDGFRSHLHVAVLLSLDRLAMVSEIEVRVNPSTPRHECGGLFGVNPEPRFSSPP
ncbi:MAG: thiamine phosphate synthase, partial [Candidatus Aminicenantes bacterium]|nr:thiamine phosphate synthase [Candidatus Aminicenantes bacterium]